MRIVALWASVARMRTVRRSSCTIHLISRRHCVRSGRLHPAHAVHSAPSCTKVPRHVCVPRSARQTTECLCLRNLWRSASNLISGLHLSKAVSLTALRIKIFSPRVRTACGEMKRLCPPRRRNLTISRLRPHLLRSLCQQMSSASLLVGIFSMTTRASGRMGMVKFHQRLWAPGPRTLMAPVRLSPPDMRLMETRHSGLLPWRAGTLVASRCLFFLRHR
mmetsp:Transcript_60549/g.160974  ORF Transcript_60549/g.160974 Transcript_60549/m.160974 type:complete len:219 (-) Transcript_60549:7-663(-)